MIDIWSNDLPGIRGDEDGTDPEDFRPHLQGPFLPEGDGPFPCMLVFPGGGYRNRAKHEGEGTAQALAARGIAAFVLQYRVRPWRYPAALMDAQRAMRLVRQRAAELPIEPNRIGVLGYSAGGHAAGTLALRWDADVYEPMDDIDQYSARPDWSALAYAVTSATDHGHQGSWLNVLGAGADWRDRAAISLDRLVRSDAPPHFLWSTSDDMAVPVHNTYKLASALADAGVLHEVHVYRTGRHGLGLAEGHVASWVDRLLDWMGDSTFM